jgi:hypothetical protein
MKFEDVWVGADASAGRDTAASGAAARLSAEDGTLGWDFVAAGVVAAGVVAAGVLAPGRALGGLG